MWGGSQRRGVSEVLGAILVFAILVSGIAVYQVTVVPQTNEEREVEHSEQIRSQMLDLRNDIQAAATTGRSASSNVNLGAEYPVRALTLNPPEGGGSLRTVGTRDDDVAVRLYNATAIDADTDDYLDGSEVVLPSGVLTYTPNYNYYRESPRTVYENTVLVQQFSGANITRSDQELVDGRRISLVTLAGQRAESEGGTVSVQTRPVSSATETVIVESSSGPISLTIPTTLSEEYWVQELLAQQIDSEYAGATSCADLDGPDPSNDDTDGQYVVDCSYTSPPGPTNELNITLQQAAGGQPVRYALEMSKVGVGSGVTDPGAAYLTTIEGDGADVALDGRQEVVFQARDKYNNPATERAVEVSPVSTGTLRYQGTPVEDISGSLPVGPDGRLRLIYQAPKNTGTSPIDITVEANLAGGSYNEDDPERADVYMQVINASRIDRTEPLLNPPNGVGVSSAEALDNDAACDTPTGNNANPCVLSVTLTNFDDGDGVDTAAEVTELRYSFYKPDSFNENPIGSSTKLELFKPESATLDLTGEFVTLDDSIELTEADGPDHSATLKFVVYGGDGKRAISQGDFFIISAIVDGDRRTFFILPEETG